MSELDHGATKGQVFLNMGLKLNVIGPLVKRLLHWNTFSIGVRESYLEEF